MFCVFLILGGLFFLSFSCFLIQQIVFSREKGIFCLFLSLSLCFSLAFFGLPLFQFLFLCLSLVIFFFLPSCLFSFGSLLLSLSFLLFLLCFCFMKGTTSKHSIAFCFINIFSFLVSCLVFSLNSFFLCLRFLISSYVFVQHECFWFQNKQQKTIIVFFGQEEVATKRFFVQPVFCKM